MKKTTALVILGSIVSYVAILPVLESATEFIQYAFQNKAAQMQQKLELAQADNQQKIETMQAVSTNVIGFDLGNNETEIEEDAEESVMEEKYVQKNKKAIGFRLQ